MPVYKSFRVVTFSADNSSVVTNFFCASCDVDTLANNTFTVVASKGEINWESH